MLPHTNTPTISAMELRRNPGTFLDRVDYRRERFIVKRGGKVKAAMVPFAELEQFDRMKEEARQEALAMNRAMQKAFAASGLTEDDLDVFVEQAIRETRPQ